MLMYNKYFPTEIYARYQESPGNNTLDFKFIILKSGEDSGFFAGVIPWQNICGKIFVCRVCLKYKKLFYT